MKTDLLEISVENDFDELERLLTISPKDELNKPRERWNRGNVLHGLVNLTSDNLNNNGINTPTLMECEYEQWLFLINKAKEAGVNTQYKNKYNETPLELLHKLSDVHILNDAVEVVLTYDCDINYK